MSRPKLVLASLGGTITMTGEGSAGIAPTLFAADLLRALPALAGVADIEPLSLHRLPGASLTLDHALALARLLDEKFAEGAEGAVVVQGTDTIEEMAFALDLLVKSDKPVAVTGAMRGPETPGADGPANVLAAAIVAASPSARGLGVVVVLNDEIHAARFVQKSHASLPSAFCSPSAGALGFVAEGRARFQLRVQRKPALTPPPTGEDAPVALIKLALGDDGRLLKVLPSLGYCGAVIEGMGAGHAPAFAVSLIAELAERMPVALSVRAPAGRTFERTYGFPGSEIDLIGKGALAAGVLGGLKARLLLSLLLRDGRARRETEAAFRAYVEDEAPA